MKKALLLLFPLLLLSTAWGKSYLDSPLPSVTNTVLDVTPVPCNAACLARHLEAGRIFSFLAKADHPEEKALSAALERYAFLLNMERTMGESELRVALLIPSRVVGRYGMMVATSVNAYLLSRQIPYQLETFDTGDESEESLKTGMAAAEGKGYRYLIAAVTSDGARRMAEIATPLHCFVPTVHIGEVAGAPGEILFGGIDYTRQLRALVPLAREEIVVFSEPQPLSDRLGRTAREELPGSQEEVEVKSNTANFKRLLQPYRRDGYRTALLNTQPVKSSLILSQFTYHDVNMTTILSTQQGYSPLLLGLTQDADVERFYVASSIGPVPGKLEETGALIRGDLRYNWIGYASAVVADLIYQRNRGDYRHASQTFGLKVKEHQVEYPVTVYRADRRRFIPFTPGETPLPPAP